jgi:hypothetical protein
MFFGIRDAFGYGKPKNYGITIVEQMVHNNHIPFIFTSQSIQMIFKLLHKVTRSLEEAGIPYMLSGSIALNR